MLPDRSTKTNTVGVFGFQVTMCSWQAPGFEPPEPIMPPAPPMVSMVPPAPAAIELLPVEPLPAVPTPGRSWDPPALQPSPHKSAAAAMPDRGVVSVRDMFGCGQDTIARKRRTGRPAIESLDRFVDGESPPRLTFSS